MSTPTRIPRCAIVAHAHGTTGKTSQRALRIAALFTCIASSSTAFAQEAMNTQAATMPSKGTFVLREQLHVFAFGSHPTSGVESTTNTELSTSLAYGLARAFAVTLDVPVVFRTEERTGQPDDHDSGVSDLELMFKYRIYKHDSGGIDTLRIALLGGADFASGDDHDFSSTSINPNLGAVLTVVRGRWGFNQDFIYTFNTGGDADSNYGGEGPDNALFFSTAGLYRIAPARFTPDSTSAWYLTAELNSIFETNGDLETRFSPGLMYEGQRFAFELMGQLPFYDDLDERAELDWGIGVGFRFAF